MLDTRCPGALSAYLGAVVDALARRGVGVLTVVIPVAGPQHALAGSLVLHRAAALPGWGPIVAAWHEELGWWAEPSPGPGPARRYLPAGSPADVAPYPTLVADFLTGLARGEDLGTSAPAIHRYRLLAEPHDLLTLLTRHTGATAASDRLPSDRVPSVDRGCRRIPTALLPDGGVLP